MNSTMTAISGQCGTRAPLPFEHYDADVLDGFVLGRLPRPIGVLVERHLQECTKCRQDVDNTEAMIWVLQMSLNKSVLLPRPGK